MNAARRIASIVGGVAGITIVVSAAVGLLSSTDLDRAVSTGLYLVGCFLVVLGFFSGVRGPVRPRGDEADGDSAMSVFGVGLAGRGARTATGDERADARATTWLFLFLGLTLILVGVAVDSKVALI